MWKLSRSAAGGWAVEPNSTNGVLKSLNVQRNITSTSVTLTGRTIGRVIERHCRKGFAPSTEAASYTSFGTDCRPAMSMRNANGQVFQIATTTTETKAFEPISQNGPVPLNRCSWSTRMWLIAPESRWNMNFQVMMPAYI